MCSVYDKHASGCLCVHVFLPGLSEFPELFCQGLSQANGAYKHVCMLTRIHASKHGPLEALPTLLTNLHKCIFQEDCAGRQAEIEAQLVGCLTRMKARVCLRVYVCVGLCGYV